MRSIIVVCLFTFFTQKGFGRITDTFQVHFELNRTWLNAGAKSLMDSLVSHHALAQGQKLIVLGYADHTGRATHNDHRGSAGEKGRALPDKVGHRQK